MVRTNCTALLNATSETTAPTGPVVREAGRSRQTFTGTAGPARVSLELSGRGQSAYEVHDEDVTDAAVDYLDRFGESRARAGEALCLSVGLMLPHQPFVARPEDYARYEGRVGLPSDRRNAPRRLPPVHTLVAQQDRN